MVVDVDFDSATADMAGSVGSRFAAKQCQRSGKLFRREIQVDIARITKLGMRIVNCDGLALHHHGMKTGCGTFCEDPVCDSGFGLVLPGKPPGYRHQIEDKITRDPEVGRQMRDRPVKQTRNGLSPGDLDKRSPLGFTEGGRCRQFAVRERPFPQSAP